MFEPGIPPSAGRRLSVYVRILFEHTIECQGVNGANFGHMFAFQWHPPSTPDVQTQYASLCRPDASTSIPSEACSTDVYSSGVWLRPSLLWTNSIATLAIFAICCVS